MTVIDNHEALAKQGETGLSEAGARDYFELLKPRVMSLVVFTAFTGLLLTGDTVYPGRLYVRDWPAYVATIERLIAFTETRPVSHVLGCHIEMTTTPGVDYPIRTMYQPDEPPLEMSVDHLRDVRRAVREIDGRPGRHVYRDFVIHCLDA